MHTFDVIYMYIFFLFDQILWEWRNSAPFFNLTLNEPYTHP